MVRDRRFIDRLSLRSLLVAGLGVALSPAMATEATKAAGTPATTRAYAACVVTDQQARTVYASDTGKVDALTVPVTLDAQAYAEWVSQLYHVPLERLGGARCVVDMQSRSNASARQAPLVKAGTRQGYKLESTRWWLSQ